MTFIINKGERVTTLIAALSRKRLLPGDKRDHLRGGWEERLQSATPIVQIIGFSNTASSDFTKLSQFHFFFTFACHSGNIILCWGEARLVRDAAIRRLVRPVRPTRRFICRLLRQNCQLMGLLTVRDFLLSFFDCHLCFWLHSCWYHFPSTGIRFLPASFRSNYPR